MYKENQELIMQELNELKVMVKELQKQVHNLKTIIMPYGVPRTRDNPFEPKERPYNPFKREDRPYYNPSNVKEV